MRSVFYDFFDYESSDRIDLMVDKFVSSFLYYVDELPYILERVVANVLLKVLLFFDPLPASKNDENVEEYFDRMEPDKAIRFLRLRLRAHPHVDIEAFKEGVAEYGKKERLLLTRLVDALENAKKLEERWIERAIIRKKNQRNK